jgi:hypothetical protein
MYVRSKILLLVVLPPQMWVLGDVRTVSVRPPCDLLRIRRAAAVAVAPTGYPEVNVSVRSTPTEVLIQTGNVVS